MIENILTNRLRKDVASLGDARSRREMGCFIAEGTKCVRDTWANFDCVYLMATSQWLNANADIIGSGITTIAVTRNDIARMSQLKTPSEVIAVYRLPQHIFDATDYRLGLTLALDGVQDPGNLGTIIRVADWFGVEHILCSPDTVDCFNPKVVQATMGAIARVKVVYHDLNEAFRQLANVPLFGTFLDGENIYSTSLPTHGIIVMGNEGKGISSNVRRVITNRLLIPSFPADRPTSESLNVAMATGIVLSEFRRRTII
jgi:TrmH family RNA methyltransferase